MIADVSQAKAAFTASRQNVAQVQKQLAAQQHITQKLQRQLDAGQIDRLELTQNRLITSQIEQQLLNAKFKQLNALFVLENSVQMPLNSANLINDKTMQMQRVNQ